MRLLAPDGLTAKQTTFTMPELVRAVAGSLRDGAPVEQVLAAADELSRLPGRRAGRAGRRSGSAGAVHDPGAARRSSSEALELALAGRDVGAPAADGRPARADAALGSGLSRRAADAGARGLVSAAIASSAWSAPPAPARRPRSESLADAYRESGVPVLGAAPSGRAADELAAGDRDREPHPAPAPARRPTATAACRAAACWSSTRPGWPRRACSRRCSSCRPRRGEGDPGRRPAAAARRSAPAASTPPSANGSARSSLTENRRQHDLVRAAGARAAARRRPGAVPRPRRQARPPPRRRRPDRRQAAAARGLVAGRPRTIPPAR